MALVLEINEARSINLVIDDNLLLLVRKVLNLSAVCRLAWAISFQLKAGIGFTCHVLQHLWRRMNDELTGSKALQTGWTFAVGSGL